VTGAAKQTSYLTRSGLVSLPPRYNVSTAPWHVLTFIFPPSQVGLLRDEEAEETGARLAMNVRKAAFPAAGLDTRFLPATKAQPKEMLPLVDKPTIRYVVEEAVASGLEEIILVTGRNKARDRGPLRCLLRAGVLLEYYLQDRGKEDELAQIKTISDLAQCPTCARRSRAAWATPSSAPSRSWATSPSACSWATTSSSRVCPACDSSSTSSSNTAGRCSRSCAWRARR
jgi:nucleotidyltransferase-like protein